MDEPQAPLTEREQFELWRNNYFGPLYTNAESSSMWTAWQARAVLASAPHPLSNTLGDASGPGDPVASLPTPPIAAGEVRSVE